MRIRLTLGLILLFFTLIGVATTVSRASAAPTLPDDPELGFLFSTNYGNGRGIFWIRPDGSQLEQIFSFTDARIPSDWLWLTLSPDGHAIIFLFSLLDTDLFSLSLLNLESGNITQLTEAQPRMTDPHLSPDGSKIAYAAISGNGTEIYVIDVRTSSQWLVASVISGTGLFGYNSMNWSPDSNQLALSLVRDGYAAIFTVSVDGSDLRMVSRPGESVSAPTWDSSGSILYYGCPGSAHRLTTICLMDVKRGLTVRLADMADYIPGREILQTLALSPGGQIAFSHSRYFGPSDQLFVFDPASGEVNAVRIYSTIDSLLQWSYRPDIP